MNINFYNNNFKQLNYVALCQFIIEEKLNRDN